MPTHDFVDIGDVLKYEFLQGTIATVDSATDTCTVSVAGSTIPALLFWHPTPDATLRDNGAIQGAADCFSTDNEVIVMKKIGGTGLSDCRVISGGTRTTIEQHYVLLVKYDDYYNTLNSSIEVRDINLSLVRNITVPNFFIKDLTECDGIIYAAMISTTQYEVDPDFPEGNRSYKGYIGKYDLNTGDLIELHLLPKHTIYGYVPSHPNYLAANINPCSIDIIKQKNYKLIYIGDESSSPFNQFGGGEELRRPTVAFKDQTWDLYAYKESGQFQSPFTYLRFFYNELSNYYIVYSPVTWDKKRVLDTNEDVGYFFAFPTLSFPKWFVIFKGQVWGFGEAQEGGLSPSIVESSHHYSYNYFSGVINIKSVNAWSDFSPTGIVCGTRYLYIMGHPMSEGYADTSKVQLKIFDTAKDNPFFNPVSISVSINVTDPVTVFNMSGFRNNIIYNAGTSTPTQFSFGHPWMIFVQNNPEFALVSNTQNTQIVNSTTLINDLNEINLFVNTTYPPSLDSGDEWDFISVKGRGDCEDYALEKAKLLLEKGYPASAIHLEQGNLIANSTWDVNGNLVTGGHMWLTVETNNGDISLDNLSDSLYTRRQVLSFYENISRQTGLFWYTMGL